MIKALSFIALTVAVLSLGACASRRVAETTTTTQVSTTYAK